MTPNPRRKGMLRPAILWLLVAPAGCAATDPLLNTDNWNPSNANEANIAAELVDPGDLVHGRAPIADSDGQLAAAAVLRLRTGHVKKLPNAGISDLKVQSDQSSTSEP